MFKGLSLLTLDVFAFPSLRCSAWGDSYYKRFDVHVGTMLAVTLVFVALLFFAYSEWNHARRAPLKPAKVWSAFLPFLFIIYPSISQTVILMLRCREVDGMSFLLSDFSLRCDTPEYGAHQVNLTSTHSVLDSCFLVLRLTHHSSATCFPLTVSSCCLSCTGLRAVRRARLPCRHPRRLYRRRRLLAQEAAA
jgi:hypothetical protein